MGRSLAMRAKKKADSLYIPDARSLQHPSINRTLAFECLLLPVTSHDPVPVSPGLRLLRYCRTAKHQQCRQTQGHAQGIIACSLVAQMPRGWRQEEY